MKDVGSGRRCNLSGLGSSLHDAIQFKVACRKQLLTMIRRRVSLNAGPIQVLGHRVFTLLSRLFSENR